MKSALLLVGFLFVGACGKSDGRTNPAADRTISDRAESDLPRPGLYAVNMTPEIIGNAPSTMISQESHNACYTPMLMERPDAFFLANALSCRRETFHVASGEVYAKMVCNLEEGPVPLELRGTYDRDGAELVVDLIYPDGTVRTTRTLKRISDC